MRALLLAGALAAFGWSGAGAQTIPLTVRTPHGGFDRLVVALTVCAPGTGRCATIDDVMVDTGSTGLRLEASAVPDRLDLPAFEPEGRPLAECLRFVHDTAWGPLRRVDLHVGGRVVADLPIQVVADDGGPQPEGCPVSTARPTSNGTLGIGPWLTDCPGACALDAPFLYEARGDAFVPRPGPVPPALRVPNPAAALGDAVAFDLPPSPRDGAARVTGTLTFGPAPGGPMRLLALDPRGRFTTRFAGRDHPGSLIDSGTEATLVPEVGLPRCPDPAWALCGDGADMVASLVGRDGAAIDVTWRVGDYAAARARGVGAWDGYAEAADPGARGFVWGAPFFLGRRVTLVFEGRPGPGGVPGPAYGLP